MSAVIQDNELLAGNPPRYNLYSAVHKALRGFMMETVTRAGRADVNDDCEFAQMLEQVRGLLQACRDHLHHENEFVHPALERAARHSSKHTSDDHAEHVRAIGALELQVNRLAAVPAIERFFLTQQLYLQLTIFVAENFVHMNVEETDNHQVLIAAYTDAELLQIKDAIVASISPQENMLMMKWMLQYMNCAELSAMLSGIKQHAPPLMFQAVIDLAREALSQRDFFKLERALA
jgi:hypothetical protein